MTRPLDIVFVGLALSSSWGNGHATTYRALLRGLADEGHEVLFLERDVPWYASARDLSDPEFCTLTLYDDVPGLIRDHAARMLRADAVIVGSYVPDGVQVIDRLAALDHPCLCFYDIDTPVTMELLDKGDEAFLAARQVPLFERYFSFSGGGVLDHLMQVRGARDARALYCAVDPDRYRPVPGVTPQWDLGYLGTYSPDRQPTLETLLLEPARQLPHQRFVVAGPGYPDSIDWPDNVERIDHLPPDDHARFYCSQRFTLNVTRAAMRTMGWSPSVRLFEAAACATPVISDAWRGLTDLFADGDAILIASRSDEVVAALTHPDDAVRRRMGQAARQNVLAHHTGRQRARELAQMIVQARHAQPTPAASLPTERVYP